MTGMTGRSWPRLRSHRIRRNSAERDPDRDARMSLAAHLRELRRRLIIIVVIIAAGAVAGWYLYDPIMRLLERPYCSVPARYRFQGSGGAEDRCVLVYHGVLDGFTTRLKTAVIAGAVLTGPLWLYQVWAYLTPGLRRNERRYTIWFVLASTVLFATGMTLAYLVLAKGLSVLLSQAGSGVQAMLTVNAYLSFVTLMLVVFGASFELPLLVVVANLAGVLPARVLVKSQRVAIFLIFVFAAVATPSTDPFTMCAMAIPMVALFEAAVGFAVLHDRRRARRKATEQAHAETARAVRDAEDRELSPLG